MGRVFVLGAATTCFGRNLRAPAEMGHQAVASALDASGHAPRDIAAVFASCRGAGAPWPDDARAAPAAGGPAAAGRFESLSHSAALALHRAWRAVEAGQYRTVLCVGVEGIDGYEDEDAAALRRRVDRAQTYVRASGATVEHLGRAAVKNYRHGVRNPAASLSREVALREVLDSEPVAGPLTRMMMTRRSAGAAALVLGAARPARRALRLRASVVADDGQGADAEARAAQLAYWAAAVGPEELDCVELHDDTAASELAAYETLQLVPPGHGADLIESGYTDLGGVVPVNTSGGLLSLGEADSASGIAQVCELALQLAGTARDRQVPGARLGLAHTLAPGDDGGRLAAVTVIAAD